jgi:hypothetical protein
MKKIFTLIIFMLGALITFGQKIDSIYFHLYTDSLKKGTHNYINVDGKLSNNKWQPLTGKEIKFTATYGEFEGNELVVPDHPNEEKITVRAELKSNPSIWKEVTIWIKKNPDNELLPTKDEVMKPGKKSKPKKSGD